MSAITFVKDDGGRAAAGFKGDTGDCVTRAIAIAAQLPYREVYDALSHGQKNQSITKRYKRRKVSARNGVSVKRKWFKDYMQSIGFEWVPTMTIGSGCRVHLTEAELPEGRLVVSVAKHYTAVVDGVLRDTWDCSWTWKERHDDEDDPIKIQGKKCVYGYWIKREE